MTKAELIKNLEPYPDNMDVFLSERKTDFGYGILNTVSEMEIPFSEEPEGKSLAKDTVIVLDED